jgi:LCP family protein required for cell wall assembly
VIGRIARALVAVLAALTFAAGLYAVDAARDRAHASIILQAVAPGPVRASYQPNRWSTTVFILALGSDERAGLTGARTDAIHVIGLNPGQGRATIINIPRDTWVDIPGHGQGRINSAYTLGGPQLAAQTVGQLVGVQLGYVLVTTFDGLKKMVDDLGGVPVDIPYVMSDPNSGAAFDPGRQRLNGEQALAWSRDRHIPDGDIARTGHQGELIIHALADLQDKRTDLTGILHALDILYRNVRIIGISAGDVYRLGRAALSIAPANVRNYTIPVTPGFKGAASVVFVHPAAGGLFADFRDDAVLQNH